MDQLPNTCFIGLNFTKLKRLLQLNSAFKKIVPLDLIQKSAVTIPISVTKQYEHNCDPVLKFRVLVTKQAYGALQPYVSQWQSLCYLKL